LEKSFDASNRRAKRYAVDAHNVPLQPFEITFVTMAQTPQPIDKREREREQTDREKSLVSRLETSLVTASDW
jgi:hypothetical protein